MIMLRRKRDCEAYLLSDGDILMGQLVNAGYCAHPSDVALAWYRHSDDLCATWLSVDEDEAEANVAALLNYLDKERLRAVTDAVNPPKRPWITIPIS